MWWGECGGESVAGGQGQVRGEGRESVAGRVWQGDRSR